MQLLSNEAIRPAKIIVAQQLVKLEKEGNEKLIEKLKYISPVAWININFYGYYKFEEEKKSAVDKLN